MSEVAIRDESVPAETNESTGVIIDAAVLLRAARDPSINIEKMERIMALAERMQAKAAEREFNLAMNRAQEEMRPIAADSVNPETNSRFASFLALDRIMRPIYTKEGFSLSFDTGEAPAEQVLVKCYVAHSGGHSREYRVLMPADGKGPKGTGFMSKTHAAGAAMTYGQRYLLKLIFNITVGDDDDGNSATSSLSDEQVQIICDLLKRAKADPRQFCQHYGIEMVADLKRKDFDDAKFRLEKKAGIVPDWAKD